MQRKRAALKMRRLKFRIARARKIKRKRFATMDMLTRRARRKARQFIRKRIAGKMGEKYVDLSPSQKMSIDRRMQKKIPFINKMAKRLLPKVRQAELVRLKAARARKESYINSSFGSLITELQTSGSPDDYGIEQLKESGNYTPTAITETSDPKLRIKESQQAEIKQEAHNVSEAVDVMVDALAALDKKAQKANVELDTLFVEFIDGYNNPHGKQTPQQGGFAAVNRLIAEMSVAEKDKAEDIVKGMKKKASYFMKKYGKDAKSVMYATANKMAQEDMQKFRKEIIEGDLEEGGWEGWERFNKSSKGKKMRKRLSKNRKRGDHKAYQFDKWGNVVDDSIGEGTYANYSKRRVPGDNVKHQMRPKGTEAGEAGRKKLAKVKKGDEHRKLARAYGIRNEGMLETGKLKLKSILDPSEKERRRSKLKLRHNKRMDKIKAQGKKSLDRMNSGKPVNEVAPAVAAGVRAIGGKVLKIATKGKGFELATSPTKAGAGQKIQTIHVNKPMYSTAYKFRKENVQEKMSAYDRINNRFKKLSGGQSLEDRSRYWQKEKEKTQAQLDAFRKEHGTQKEAVMDTAAKNTVITGYKKEPVKNPKMPIDDIKKRLQNKSNRVKDAKMVKKMNKVLFRHREDVDEGMGAAYMPDAKEKKTPAREITSKAVLKQLNRNRNRGAMKGKVRTPNVRYVHDRQRETDLTAAQRGKTVINPEEKKKGRGHRKKKGRKSKKK